jgi:hypothetical protein
VGTIYWACTLTRGSLIGHRLAGGIEDGLVDDNCEGVDDNCEGVNNNCEGVDNNCEGVDNNCEGVSNDCERVGDCKGVDNSCERADDSGEGVNDCRNSSLDKDVESVGIVLTTATFIDAESPRSLTAISCLRKDDSCAFAQGALVWRESEE